MSILRLFLILTCLAWGHGAAQAAENSCIACHNHLPEGSRISQRHKDFTGSTHQKNGVACQDCHGGDPTRTGKDEAHTGVLPAGNPKSTVFYKSIPATCGRCHSAEYSWFTDSHHYKKLVSTGQGPNCVTCHGSMATHVLDSSQAREFCVVCHNPKMKLPTGVPVEAEITLALMQDTTLLVQWATEFAKSPAGAERERELSTARSELSAARAAWHGFNLQEVRDHLKRAAESARKAKELPK